MPFCRFREQGDTPPGDGKKSTKDRNLRRRAARKALAVAQKKAVGQQIRQNRAAAQVNGDAGAEEAAGTPREDLVGREVDVQAEAVQGMVVPAATASSNKRKSYLMDMQGKTGKKMVFSSPGQHAAETVASPHSTPQTPVRSAPTTHSPGSKQFQTPSSRPITPSSQRNYTTALPPFPPSQMRNLPPNVIISQQWYKMESKQDAAKARKNASRRAKRAEAAEDVSMGIELEEAEANGAADEVVAQTMQENTLEIIRKGDGELEEKDWEVIEARLEELPVVTKDMLGERLGEVLVFKASLSASKPFAMASDSFIV